MRLAGFRKVSLRPGQSRRVGFAVDVPDLAFFDAGSGRYRVDRGRYGLRVGSSSADPAVRSRAVVTVTGALDPTPAFVTARPVVAGDAAAGISQRVSFPAGSRIDPQLTVSFSDESLAGYRTLGASTPLPDGMRVRYASNRPEVVTAGPDGLVAGRPGVATVTATVRYRGGSATGTFVVLVPGTPA